MRCVVRGGGVLSAAEEAAWDGHVLRGGRGVGGGRGGAACCRGPFDGDDDDDDECECECEWDGWVGRGSGAWFASRVVAEGRVWDGDGV